MIDIGIACVRFRACTIRKRKATVCFCLGKINPDRSYPFFFEWAQAVGCKSRRVPDYRVVVL